MPSAERGPTDRLLSRHLPPPALRTMDLYGRTEDGRLVIWLPRAQVIPVSAFGDIPGWDGLYIESGHYLIEDEGDAVVAHCGNTPDGLVVIQFMCSLAPSRLMQRSEIEPKLLGKVYEDPQETAELGRIMADIERRMILRKRGDL